MESNVTCPSVRPIEHLDDYTSVVTASLIRGEKIKSKDLDFGISNKFHLYTGRSDKKSTTDKTEKMDWNYEQSPDPGRKLGTMFAEKLKKLLPRLPESRPASASLVKLVHTTNVNHRQVSRDRSDSRSSTSRPSSSFVATGREKS